MNLVCMHGSLFSAYHFSYNIQKEYVGVRNIMGRVSNSGPSDVLRQIPFVCGKWFWPPIIVERDGNILFSTVCSGKSSLWRSHDGIDRHYVQWKNTSSYPLARLQPAVLQREYSNFMLNFLRELQTFCLWTTMHAHTGLVKYQTQ